MLCEIVEDHSPFYIKFKFNGVEDFFKKCRDELQNHKLDGGLPVYQRRIDELRADEFLNMLPFSNKINFQKHRLAYIITKPRSSFPIHIDKASISFNFGIDIKDEHCITRWFSSHDIASNYRSQGPDPHNRDVIPDEEWNRVQIEPIKVLTQKQDECILFNSDVYHRFDNNLSDNHRIIFTLRPYLERRMDFFDAKKILFYS